ncbi:uncharacterized protein [Procambarus clarkii]|uniref:uncharacterized protein n=1 Tax=Procambarus clarkii TaxID=6728 RepID=UPI00374233DF
MDYQMNCDKTNVAARSHKRKSLFSTSSDSDGDWRPVTKANRKNHSMTTYLEHRPLPMSTPATQNKSALPVFNVQHTEDDTPPCIDLTSNSSSSGCESDTAGQTVPTSGSHREGRTRSRAHSTPRSSPSPIPQSISDSYDSSSNNISSSSSGENISITDSDSDDSSAYRDLDPPASVNSDLLAPSGIRPSPSDNIRVGVFKTSYDLQGRCTGRYEDLNEVFRI